MNTLPRPMRLMFSCADRNGTQVYAVVTANQDIYDSRCVWHAVFSNTGEPPAEMMGSSENFSSIEADVCARVSRLQVVGYIERPVGISHAQRRGDVAGH